MLTIHNLHAGYGKVQVLHGLSIEVPRGKVVTLIGSNGAGKTTTMRAISGMIAPTAGEITLNGRRIDGLESFRIAKLGLAHSPEGRRVFATMTVLDNLTLGAFPRLTGSRPRGDVAQLNDRRHEADHRTHRIWLARQRVAAIKRVARPNEIEEGLSRQENSRRIR